jgi:hypothetical protein
VGGACEGREKCTSYGGKVHGNVSNVMCPRHRCEMGSKWILGRLAGGCRVDSVGSVEVHMAVCMNMVINLRMLVPWI